MTNKVTIHTYLAPGRPAPSSNDSAARVDRSRALLACLARPARPIKWEQEFYKAQLKDDAPTRRFECPLPVDLHPQELAVWSYKNCKSPDPPIDVGAELTAVDAFSHWTRATPSDDISSRKRVPVGAGNESSAAKKRKNDKEKTEAAPKKKKTRFEGDSSAASKHSPTKDQLASTNAPSTAPPASAKVLQPAPPSSPSKTSTIAAGKKVDSRDSPAGAIHRCIPYPYRHCETVESTIGSDYNRHGSTIRLSYVDATPSYLIPGRRGAWIIPVGSGSLPFAGASSATWDDPPPSRTRGATTSPPPIAWTDLKLKALWIAVTAYHSLGKLGELYASCVVTTSNSTSSSSTSDGPPPLPDHIRVYMDACLALKVRGLLSKLKDPAMPSPSGRDRTDAEKYAAEFLGRKVRLFKIKHPILLAGMNVAAGPELAAAVTNAGGLGVLGGVGYTPKFLQQQIDELKESLVDKNAPFGIDLLIPQVGGNARKTNTDYTGGKLPELIDVIIKNKAALFVCAVGVPPAWAVDKLHAAGILCANMVGSPKHVPKALESGADFIFAQGSEGGGHTGDIATSILIPACVEAVKGKKSKLTGAPILVVAAGGISNGKGLASALAMGAAGVWVGTRFICSEEAGASKAHQDAVMSADHSDTIRTIIFTGRPLRVKKTPFIMDWEDNKQDEIKRLTSKGILPVQGDEVAVENRPHLMGAVAAVVDRIEPAKKIVDDMVNEAAEMIKQSSSYLTSSAKL